MHGSYTNRKALKVAMHDKYTISYSIISHPLRLSSQFAALVQQAFLLQLLLPSVFPPRLCPNCLCCAGKYSRAKMLLIVRTQYAVALNYSLSRHTEYVRQIILINSLNVTGVYICLIFTSCECERRIYMPVL